MKISKLYIRIFLTVMCIIIISQLVIAGLYRYINGTAGKQNAEPEILGIAFLVQKQFRTNDDFQKKNVKLFLEDLSRAWASYIWLEDSEGNLISSSNPIKRPPFPRHMEPFNEYGLSRERGGPPTMHMIIRLHKINMFLYIKKDVRRIIFDDFYFGISLVIITIIIAFILFLVTKQVTVPFKKLTESANSISRGEFDTHVNENFADEAGDLAKAFNTMTNQILQMVNGTKELTANISHHIRSPLARITVLVELIRNKILNNKNKETIKLLSSVEYEVNEIVKLTEDIIELVRVDIAHKNDEYRKVSVTDIATEVSKKYMNMIESKSIKFKSQYTKIPIYIYGVHHDISEIFDILFDNAVCYTPENGYIDLKISDENKIMTIIITNNGSNFKDGSLKSVFTPFKRFAPEKIPGNGLGLAIIKKIVENHKGAVQATSMNNEFSIKIVFSKDA